MPRKPTPPAVLAQVAKLPRSARRARPFPSLASAVERGSERDLLVLLRQRLAEVLDGGELAGQAFSAAVRQLRAVDQEVRQLDAREAARAEDTDDGDGDGGDQPWDASRL